MKNVGSGSYNRHYTWLQQTTTQDSETGAPVESWNAVGDVWGSMELMRANELLAYSMKAIEAHVRIRIRGFSLGVKFVDRLLDKDTNEVYLIDGILVDKINNQLVCTCHRFGDRNTTNTNNEL